MESVPVKSEIISLRLLVNETAKKWEKQMTEKGMQLDIAIPRNSCVYADYFLIAIVMDNVVSNAINYGAINGKIKCDWDEIKKIFSISNNGPGITAEFVPFLFNRFYKVDNSRSSHISGSGLGLPIVKQFCADQQIAISVQSDEAITTFLLQFP